MTYNSNKHHRRSTRLTGYNYALAGAYFITLVTQNRRCIFGEVLDGEMVLNEYGQIAYEEWLKTPAIRPNLSLDVFVVMPSHMHAVFVIVDVNGHSDDHQLPPNALLLRGEQPVPFRSPSRTVGAIVRGYKGVVTKQLQLLNLNGKIWQRGYHDHIIQTEQSYQNISSYIINNPKKWSEDKFYRK